jgi:hypothetical protein
MRYHIEFIRLGSHQGDPIVVETIGIEAQAFEKWKPGLTPIWRTSTWHRWGMVFAFCRITTSAKISGGYAETFTDPDCPDNSMRCICFAQF